MKKWKPAEVKISSVTKKDAASKTAASIVNAITDCLKQVLGQAADGLSINIDTTPNPEMGDFSFACFSIVFGLDVAAIFSRCRWGGSRYCGTCCFFQNKYARCCRVCVV